MRYYEYTEPTSENDPSPIFIRRSEDEILHEYAAFFIEKGIKHQKNGGNGNYTFTLTQLKQVCIDDWIVINWASEVFPE